MIKKDWEVGIKEAEAAIERAKHTREDIAECMAILDDLFPESEEQRKPDPPKVNVRQYGKTRER